MKESLVLHGRTHLTAQDVALTTLLGLEDLPYGVAVFDREGNPVFSNAAYREALDAMNAEQRASHAARPATTRGTRVVAGRIEGLTAEIAELVRTGPNDTFADVETHNGWVRRVCHITSDGVVLELMFPVDALIRERDDLDRAKGELEHQATHDPLTGLPNRRGLETHLKSQIGASGEALSPLAVLHVDLDKFKAVNDTHGHQVGDLVLEAAAKVLRSSVRSNDYVARIGGDEFVLVCAGFSEPGDVTAIASRIVDRMAEPIPFGDEYCQIGASIGIAFANPGRPAANLVHDADIALYDAKAKGRGQYALYSAELRKAQTDLQCRAYAVAEALKLNAFEPHFAPRVASDTGRVSGFDVVPIWAHIERGAIGAARFGRDIDDARKWDEIFAMIGRKALGQLQVWRDDGTALPGISLPVTARMLADPAALKALRRGARRSGLAPSAITLCLPEAELDGLDKDAAPRIARMHQNMGIRLALDEFGSGRASLLALRALPFDEVRIDAALSAEIVQDEGVRGLVSAIATMARARGMDVMANGVRDASSRSLMISMGISACAGPHVGRPLAAAHVPGWLSARKEAPATIRDAADN